MHAVALNFQTTFKRHGASDRRVDTAATTRGDWIQGRLSLRNLDASFVRLGLKILKSLPHNPIANAICERDWNDSARVPRLDDPHI